LNLAGTLALPVSPETGTWYRAIQAKYWPTALSTLHTSSFPSRFNEGPTATPPFQIFYLAESHLIALFEVQALFGSLLPPGLVIPNPHGAWTVLNVQVQLNAVANLTILRHQATLAATAQELTGDWQGYHHRGMIAGSVPLPTAPAPTQELGAALYAVPNLEGFITISARVPTHKILVVFPQKLDPKSYLEFSDPHLGTHRIDSPKVHAP
jgi:hypothetical protein